MRPDGAIIIQKVGVVDQALGARHTHSGWCVQDDQDRGSRSIFAELTRLFLDFFLQKRRKDQLGARTYRGRYSRMFDHGMYEQTWLQEHRIFIDQQPNNHTHLLSLTNAL